MCHKWFGKFHLPSPWSWYLWANLRCTASTSTLFPFYTLHSHSISTWIVLKPLSHHSILWHSAALEGGRLYYMSESAIVIVNWILRLYAWFQRLPIFHSYLLCRNICGMIIRYEDAILWLKCIQQIEWMHSIKLSLTLYLWKGNIYILCHLRHVLLLLRKKKKTWCKNLHATYKINYKGVL